MPGFCVSCGAPMTGAFCNQCGARAASASPQQSVPTQAPVPPPAPVMTQPAAPATPEFQPVHQPSVPAQPSAAATTSSGIGKILLWVGGILLLLFVLGAGAAIYGVYWVKHKVSNYASAVTGNSSETTVKVVANGDNCRLLPTTDLQQVLGVPIEKSAEIVEDSVPGCAYYTNQAAFAQLQRMSMELARKQADEVNKRPGPKDDNLGALLKDANKMEGIVKTLGLTQPPADGRVFSFTVERNGDADSWSGIRLTESTVPGFEEVPGVGDHAAIGSFGHAFYAQKGNAMLHLDTMWVPDAKTRGAALATKIIGNL